MIPPVFWMFGVMGGTTPAPTATPHGGGFFDIYEAARAASHRRRKRLEDQVAQVEEIKDEVDHEIARLLAIQETKDAERAELDRLSALAQRFANNAPEASERVVKALARAIETQSAAALAQLQIQIERQLQEEELVLLLLLNQ